MSSQYDAALVARVHAELAANGGSVSGAATALGLARAKVRRILAAHPDGYRAPAPPPPADPDAECTRTLTEDAAGNATLLVKTDEVVRTLADAVRVGQVDLTVWYVDRYELSDWTVPMNVKRGQAVTTLTKTNAKGESRQTEVLAWNPSASAQTQQYRVKLYLKRIVKKAIKEALDAVYERMKAHAPAYPKADKAARPTGEGFLAVLGLVDAHLGKLCWAPETGDNYDLRIAEGVYRNAVDDLMAEAGGRAITQWVLPLGNDFYHFDNARNTTFSGTPQDVDGRYAKVIEAGMMAVVWAVERLIQVAPVSLIWCPGNHDPTTSYHLSREVAAWFRRSDRVAVDYGPSPRKYFRWNSTLLGFTHGNEEKTESLPNLMATERPDDWAATKTGTREWLIGHMHRSRQWVTKPVDTFEGTTVRVLTSLAGTDAWHHRRGYISTKHSAEVLFYGRDRGYAGHAMAPARMG